MEVYNIEFVIVHVVKINMIQQKININKGRGCQQLLLNMQDVITEACKLMGIQKPGLQSQTNACKEAEWEKVTVILKKTVKKINNRTEQFNNTV